MIRKFMSLALVVFVTACVPITPEPATPEPAVATEECYPEGVVDGYALQPGQSAIALQTGMFLAMSNRESGVDPGGGNSYGRFLPQRAAGRVRV